jgi:hypothetical protein
LTTVRSTTYTATIACIYLGGDEAIVGVGVDADGDDGVRRLHRRLLLLLRRIAVVRRAPLYQPVEAAPLQRMAKQGMKTAA